MNSLALLERVDGECGSKDREGSEGGVSDVRKGAATQRRSRKETIRFIDGMAKEVFAKRIEEAERSGAVTRLEKLVLSWPERK